MDLNGLIKDALGVLRRRWLLLAVPIVIGSVLAVGVALLLPPIYESTARILVESQRIPNDLARSTVTSGTNERIQLIEQRLMTRKNLLEIAEQYNLYRGRDDLSPSDVVELMRESTQIRPQRYSGGRRRDVSITSVTITYAASTPAKAARVANEFVSRILEQNVKARTERASGTLDFFNREVARLDKELEEAERRITEFKRENQEALPESLQFRRTELSTLQQKAFSYERDRLELEERKRQLERALAIGEAALSPSQPLSPEEEELRRLRRSLAQQRSIYAETHPSIRSLNSRISALETAIGRTASDADTESLVLSPAEEALRQIEIIEQRLEILDEQERDDAERVAMLQDSILRTPQVDIELSALQRARGALQVQHQQAVQKQAQAVTGERLEVDNQAERFEVIEQARIPEEPASPNRPIIAAAGFVGSAAFGGALMVLVELLNLCIRTPRDLERQLQLRPIVTIPYIRTAAEIRRRRIILWTIGFVALVLAPLSLFAIDQYYMPLPLLVEKIMDETGLDSWLAVLENRLAG